MTNKPPLRIVFMGTPDFAVPCLQALLDAPEVATVLAVFTQPDRPAGRGMELKAPPVKTLALEHGIPVHQPENINRGDSPRLLADLMVDVAVVVAYSHFLGKAVLNTPRLGCVNVHGSLLPQYRGAAPIQYALLNGDMETGVTTMKLVEKMDAGPILLRGTIPIPSSMTCVELYGELSKLGAELLVETLRGLRDGTVKEIPQDETQATYAKIINKEDGRADFTHTARSLCHRIRAFTPWPGVFAPTSKGVMKFSAAEPVDNWPGAPEAAKPGQWTADGERLLVKCGDGWLRLLMVQLEGKKPVTAEQFLHGLQGKKDEFQFL